MGRMLAALGLQSRKGRRFDYTFDIARVCADLAPELTAPVELRRADPPPVLRGELATLFQSTPGAHKWHHYFEIYEELFTRLRDRPIRMLEIGVFRGASLNVWRGYFAAGSTIVGLDIDPECARFDAPASNVHVRIGPQQDAAFLAAVTREFGPFDLIVDDGSHMTSHQIASFNQLFDAALKPGGLYLVEDMHTNVWRRYRDSPRSFFDFSRGLAECMYAHYTAATRSEPFQVGHELALASAVVPRIATLLREIRFLDSVIAIRKASGATLPQSQHW